MKRQIASLILALALALCVGLLPTGAGAEEIPQTDPVILTADQCTIEGNTLTVHEGVGWFTLIGSDLELGGITTLVLPSTAYGIRAGDIYRFAARPEEVGCASLTTIRVDEENPSLSSVDGVLFNKEQSALVCYPHARTGSYTVPDGVTEIGFDAFAYCDGLSGVTLPGTLTTIGERAFDGCCALTDIVIPEGVTVIPDGAFRDCYALTGVTLPGTLTAIREIAFEGCYELTGAAIPEGVTEIGGGAFAYCFGLTGVTLPSTLTTIGERAFEGCHVLTGLVIPERVTEIGSGAFAENGLMEIQVAEGNTAYCARDGVLFTKDMTVLMAYPGEKEGTYTIPEGVEEIAEYGFCGSDGLTGVIIPEGVTTIGNEAFSCCDGLLKLFIPASTAQIGKDIVVNCLALTEVETAQENTTYCSRDGVLFTKDMTTLLAFPAGRNGTYAVPEGVTTLGHSAFKCNALSEIVIPQSVTAILDEGFSGSRALTRVTIPGNVSVIGRNAFSRSERLGRVTLLSGVTTLENWAFTNCRCLTGISIPASVTEIGEWVFNKSEHVTIYGEAGSAAETYADRNGIPFVAGEMPEDIPITEEMFTIDLSPVTYTGEPQTKTVSGMDGDRVLVEERDYVVEYRNNVEVGEASLIITGMGDYYGRLTYPFTIQPAQAIPEPPARPSRPSTPSTPSTPTEPEPEKPIPASEIYRDVEAGSWYEEAVTYVVEAGLFQGTGEDTFAPTIPVTRGMIMTVLARYDGLDTSGGDKWYDKGVAWAVEKEISDGTRPEDNVTREELTTLLWRYAGRPETQNSLENFPDGTQASSWAVAALRWAVEQGILIGKGDGLLDPHGTATRAEVAIILMRYCQGR